MSQRAVVVGSGPNGLVAAIVLATAGLEVEVLEAESLAGGGLRSADLTLPGFVHDVCSGVHPLAAASPVFREVGVHVDFVHSPAPAAHPFDDGSAIVLERSIEATGGWLGADAAAYRRLLAPFVAAMEAMTEAPRLRERAGALARAFASLGARRLPDGLAAAEPLLRSRFRDHAARGFLAGHAAHSMLPLDRRPSAGVGLVLAALGHAAGWPIVRGGSGRLAEALVARLRETGGDVSLSTPVDELPSADLVVCDVAPRELVRLARGRFPAWYERALRRYRHGPGAFKVDWALAAPIPWSADECLRAATVHLGATLDEITQSERAPWEGRLAERPFVLLSQPSLFDDLRAPAGKHTAWAYCHVPNGSTIDALESIEAQLERFAPGFRELVLARSVLGPRELERHNRNLVGGDVNCGVLDVGQLLFRPVRRVLPYRTPLPGVFLCSAATPPGGGVHGLCGYAAAHVALRSLERQRVRARAW
jgi:phytoene dehydrogenase-like protein